MSIRDSLSSVKRKVLPPVAPPPPPTAPAPAAKKPGPRPQKTPPPIVRYEDVTAACGHVEKFGLYDDKKDAYRDARRKKITGRPCKECRAVKARQTREQEQQNALAKRGRQGVERHRLPHGARFDVVYDAAAMTWSGSLAVPREGESPVILTGQSGGVFGLLHLLDVQYRKWRDGSLRVGTPAGEEAHGGA